MGWSKRWRRRLRAVLRSDEVERELSEEMAFHLEMEVEKNLRAGLSPAEARRRAAIAFGGVEKAKEEVRDARWLGWASGLSLDLKLGARMLAKYPGLTLVGGLAMAFAIGAGAATFEVMTQLVHPRLPLEQGSRIVGIQTWDAAEAEVEGRVAPDFAIWREELSTVRDLGAFRVLQRNLAVADGAAEPVPVAEMSAAGFRTARVPPLLGRYLVEEDERAGAAPVVVIGHDLWQRRFGGDAGVVGREVRLGGVVHTLVGVMPEGFGFPYTEGGAWTPLRIGAAAYAPGEGPEIRVFGRLAPGATLGEAQAQLSALAARAAGDSPETHRHQRPQVMPYARSVLGVPWGIVTGAAYSTNAGVVLFLLLICANVAALVFARTATRESELVVRTALGASRRRIVLQLFAEALVLGSIAAALGLAAARYALRWGMAVFERVTGELPFWFHPDLSARTVLYAVFLALLAAAVSGVLPALKMTGRGMQARLRQAGVGGAGVRFGRLWTGIIVTQVALTAFAVPIVADAGLDTGEIRAAEVGFAAEEHLSARLLVDREAGSGGAGEADARLGAAYGELERRLLSEPAVIGVTFASQLPGAYHPRRRIELEEGPASAPVDFDPRPQTATVAPDFFDVLRVPLVAGRGFHPADVATGARVVVVNESFARHILGDRNPVGRRFRYAEPRDPDRPAAAAAEPEPWYEIVGVARDISMTIDPDLDHNGGIYHAAAPSMDVPLRLIVHLRGEAASFAPRLRALATAVDPTLRLHDLRSVADARNDTLDTYRFWARMAYLGCGIVLLLSVLGIHSILSFTVARRTREIGIRMALGADRRRVLGAIFRRAFAQVGVGIAGGTMLLIAASGGIHSARGAWLLGGAVGLMLAATAIACVVPTRRALGIQPTEAMRADA